MKFNREQTRNNVTVIGSIGAIDLREGTGKSGQPYIMGTLTVKADDSEFKVSFFENKTWGVGTDNPRPNPKFTEIQNMSEGQVVNLSCALEENKFKAQDGNIVSTQRLSLSFINKVNQTDEPGFSFDITGVVVKPLREVRDEQDNLKHYTIEIGQGQFRTENGFSVVKLDVPAENTAAATFMRDNYTLHKTVRVTGYAKATVEEIIRKVDSQFGEAMEQKFQNYRVNYFISSGLQVEETANYTQEQIDYLVKATADFEETLKSASSAPKAETKAPAGGGAASLLGL